MNMLNKVKYKCKSDLKTLSKNPHNDKTKNQNNSCNENVSKYENNRTNNNNNNNNKGFNVRNNENSDNESIGSDSTKSSSNNEEL